VARLLGNAISETQKARLQILRILAKHGKTDEIPYPDITTKAKAQEFIGLRMEDLKKEKEEFIKTVIPRWDEEAKAREAKWVQVEEQPRE
jgi:nitrite reductase (cytochrome c-552)